MGKYKDKINTNNEKIEQLTDVVRNKKGGYSVTQNIDGDNCTLYIKDSGATNPLSGLIDGTATEITIPYGTTEIAAYAFAYKGKLKKINIPKTVTRLGYYHPVTGTAIDGYSFNHCESLEELDLSSITTIGTFYRQCNRCYNLKRVIFNDNVTINSSPFGVYAFGQCSKLEDINLPENITHLGNYMFDDCSSLKELKGGWKNITQLDDYCFNNCTSLDMPELPEGFVRTGGNCFRKCSSLKWKYLPSTLTTITYNSFEKCTSLTEMTFKGNITNIGGSSFEGCINLTKFSFPNNTAVPTLQKVNALPNGANFTGTIEVPSGLLNTWKAATNWSSLTQATWVGI